VLSCEKLIFYKSVNFNYKGKKVCEEYRRRR